MRYYCIAQRGRGDGWKQRWEMRTDNLVSSLTSVQKDTMIAILTKARTELGKEVRRQYKNDIGVPFNGGKYYAPRKDGISNTITSFPHDNMIMENNTKPTELTYKPNPTKEDLLEYFSQRIAVRKMTPREAFRLMDVEEEDIEKIMAYPYNSYKERVEAMKTKYDKNEIPNRKQAISKTAFYKLAGNSIVVSCLFFIFKNLFITPASKPEETQPKQLTLDLWNEN